MQQSWLRIKSQLELGLLHSFADGDFREVNIFDGQTVRPEWYIDKNQPKIETDF